MRLSRCSLPFNFKRGNSALWGWRCSHYREQFEVFKVTDPLLFNFMTLVKTVQSNVISTEVEHRTAKRRIRVILVSINKHYTVTELWKSTLNL